MIHRLTYFERIRRDSGLDVIDRVSRKDDVVFAGIGDDVGRFGGPLERPVHLVGSSGTRCQVYQVVAEFHLLRTRESAPHARSQNVKQ